MPKFCRYCGKPLSENAAFCGSCGKPVSQAGPKTQKILPETRLCNKCGRENAAAAKFCRYCGNAFTSPDPKNARPAPAAANDSAASKRSPVIKADTYKEKTERKEKPAGSGGFYKRKGQAGGRPAVSSSPGKGTKKGGFHPGFVIGIAVCLAVVLIPLVFLPGKGGGTSGPGQQTSQTAGPGSGPGSSPGPSSGPGSGPVGDAVPLGGTGDAVPLGGGADAAGEDDPAVLTSDELPFRYTEKQLQDAPVMSAKVTPSEGKASLGSVTVDIPSWELPDEGDTIEVRELPELSQGEDGWSLRAYDFSLASGTHEFDSDIKLMIPREGASGYSGVVWYNEDSGSWEDVYSEVSDDGKYYTVYTDHFTFFAEKKYRVDKDTLQLVEDKGEKLDLDHGIFTESRYDKKDMERKVRIDYERFWNMFRKTNLDHIGDIGRSIDLINAEPNKLAQLTEGGYPPALDIAGEIFGQVGNMDSGLQMYHDLIGAKYESPEGLGQVLAIADVALTGYKIYAEAKSDRTNTYAKALFNTLGNHKMDLTSSTFSVAGALAPAAYNPVFAIVGLSMYAYSQAYQKYYENGVEEWYRKYYPDEGEVFRRFYEETGVVLYFDTKETREKAKKDYHVAIMEKPAGMDEKKYQQFRDAVNEKGLRTFSYRGFATAFSKLIELYADDTKELERVMDDFFHSVSWAIWQLPTAPGTKKSPQKDFLDDHKGLGKDPFTLPRTEQLKLSESYFMKLKIDTAKILENVAYRFQRKACEGLINRLEKEFLPVMNKVLVFHVRDASLSGGQSFADSAYCVDWQPINSNRRYRSLPDAEGSVFDDGFTAPIRFDKVNKPVFLPFDQEGNQYSEREYYPYAPNFIPQADKKSDVVFRCTYYHYLMMGAPRKMIFKNIQTGKEEKADITIPKLDPADRSRKVDVYVTVNEQKLDIPAINATLYYNDMKGTGNSAKERSPENKVTVSPSGEVTITLAALNDYRITYSEGAMAEKNYEVYSRPGLTFTGKVREFDPNGHARGEISVGKIDGSGGFSQVDEPEKLNIMTGYLTGNPGGFEDHWVAYSNGELSSDSLTKVRKIGIAPAGFKAEGFDMGGYSTFLIWQSKETGAVGVSIRLRGDIMRQYNGDKSEGAVWSVTLIDADPCDAPDMMMW